MAQHQLSLTLIPHKMQDSIIEQRAVDGYINATALCQAAGKLWGNYWQTQTTKDFLLELSSFIGMPINELIQSKQGPVANGGGTWAHPKVAIHLGQWLSAKFAVQVTEWVHDWMSGKGGPSALPYHLKRHLLNAHKIPVGYFSILQEMTNALTGPMEAHGHRLSEKVMPDISQAKMLCRHLRDHFKFDTSSLPKYSHEFQDGRKVMANLYPVEYLGVFRTLMDKEWIPNKAADYFKTRDPGALLALDKMLLLADSAKARLAA